MARSSFLGRVVTYASLVPFIGETVMRLRSYFVMKDILRGGVADPESIPQTLLKEMYLVGNRRGHYRAFRVSFAMRTPGRIHQRLRPHQSASIDRVGR